MRLFRKGHATGAEPPAPARKRQALIVDDDLTIAQLNESVFAGRPWEVATAFDGLGALAAINTRSPDPVLLDLMLPDVPGEKVLDSIRSLRLPTKVIVVTGRYVTKKDFEPWVGLVVYVLRKPYPMVDLRGLIDRFEAGALLTPKLSQVGDA